MVELTTLGWRTIHSAIPFSILEVVKQTLAEVSREVFHLQVGLKEQTEAHCIDTLEEGIK